MFIHVNGRSDTKAATAKPQLAQRDHPASRSVRAASGIPQRPGAEHYDALLWRLNPWRETAGKAGFFVGLTGCSRQSGVSTLAANLAIRAADHHLGPVLLVDVNFQQPSLGRLLDAESGLGLADVLAGQATVDDCLQSTQAIGLDLLPMGGVDRLNRIRVAPQQVDAVVAQLREQYALVICDLPEAHVISDAALLAGALDAVLLIVRSERVRRQEAQQAVRSLAAVGVPLIGAVVTDQQRYLPPWLDRLL